MPMIRLVLLLGAAVALAGCRPGGGPEGGASPTTAAGGPTSASSTTSATAAGSAEIEVRYRIEVRTTIGDVGSFASVVEQTLTDPRGWVGAGFRLVRDDAAAPYRIVLAEGPEVDALCRPYDTYGKYSCQNGPVVALNADRWRAATPQWTGDLATYRQMLVNHEVGHLLGQHHPTPQCPGPGMPAPIMAQQSTELDGCRPNPWPLPHEIERAARHDLPLAPPFSR